MEYCWVKNNTGIAIIVVFVLFIAVDVFSGWKEYNIHPDFDITCITVNNRDNNIVYAGGNGVILKTTDGSKTWQVINIPQLKDNIEIKKIIIDKFDFKILYVITSYNKLFRSIDNGLNWEYLNSEDTYFYVRELYQNDNKDRPVLFTYNENGIYKSLDRGLTWLNCSTGLPIFKSYSPDYKGIVPIDKIIFHPTDSNIIYIATPLGIYKSFNEGETWIWANLGLPLKEKEYYMYKQYECKIEHIIINKDNPDLLIVYAGHTSQYGIFRTIDGAASWEKVVKEGIIYPPLFLMFNSKVSNEVYAIREMDRSIYLISKDYGENWKIENKLPEEISSFSEKKMSVLYSIKEGGICRSFDAGKTWQFVYKKIKGSPIENILVDSNNSEIMYFLNKYGFYKSNERGEKWKILNTGIEKESITCAVINHFKPNNLFLGVRKIGIIKSEDGGSSWEICNINRAEKEFYISEIVITSNAFYAYSFDSVLYKSTDEGDTWFPLESLKKFGNRAIYCLMVDPKDLKKIFIGTNNGIFKSLDEGENWENINITSVFSISKWVETIAISPHNSDVIFIVTNDYKIYKSEDEGRKWNECQIIDEKNGRYDYEKEIIIFDHTVDWIYTNRYYSEDNGNVFKPMNSGLKGGISSMIFDKKSELLYAGTTNGSFYVCNPKVEILAGGFEVEKKVEKEKVSKGSGFIGTYNYVIPSSEPLEIKFYLNDDAWVDINIVDETGKVVSKIADWYVYPRGENSVSFWGTSDDGTWLSEGMYQIKLQTADVTRERSNPIFVPLKIDYAK